LKRADLRRKWLAIPKQQHFTISRHASPCGGFLFAFAHGSLKSPACSRVSIMLPAASLLR
jgi:hypothetical protein